MKAAFIAALLSLALCATVRANGKFYIVPEEVPPGVPYQRALIIADEGEETLVLQSQYTLPDSAEDGRIGWVVPVPAVPELASMPADEAASMFRYLGQHTSPSVVHYGGFVGVTCVVVLLVGLVVLARRVPGGGNLLVLAAVLLAFAIVFYAGIGVSLNSAADGGVEILKAEQVGVYEASVVRSDEPDALIRWLGEHDFAFDEGDEAAFQDYIDRGWCFVVARLGDTEEVHKHEVTSEGLAAPLIMRFPVETPVYPLVLTSLAETDTEVVLYTLSDHRLTCDERLEVRWAGEASGRRATLERNFLLPSKVDPPSFYPERNPEDEQAAPNYLCKFKGTLTPEQMRTDLVFEQAPDDEPYRATVHTW